MISENSQSTKMARSSNPVPLRFLISAGETSGDEHTAGVVEQLKFLRPDAEVFGMGGGHLAQAGMELIIDARHAASVMGLTEVVGSLHKIYRAYKQLVEAAAVRKPDLAILVDFPDFNLRLAKKLSKMNIPVLYFISPQIWAWRSGRVHSIKRYVKKVIPIFPFEESYYRQHGIEAEYLGHPFLDRPPCNQSRDEFLRENGLDPSRPVVALLPGSRRAEVERLLVPLLESFQELKRTRPEIQAAIPVAGSLDLDWFRSQLTAAANGVVLIPGKCRELLNSATAAVVASGTATVEAALAKTPFVVVYKLSPLTFILGKLLVRGVSHVAMANLIAGKHVVEELLQSDVTPTRIAAEVEKLLGDSGGAVRSELELLGSKLQSGSQSGKSVAERVAQVAMEMAVAGNTK